MSNEAYESLLSRRSVRSYKPEKVDEETIDAILTAGQYAPSGMGRQPFAFLAVQDEALRNELSRLNGDVMRKVHPDYSGDPFYGAPLIIAVLADTYANTYINDGSCAIENILLACHSLNLGSCYINRAKEVFKSEEGKKILEEMGIPENFEGIGFVAAGYTDASPAAAERKSLVRKAL